MKSRAILKGCQQQPQPGLHHSLNTSVDGVDFHSQTLQAEVELYIHVMYTSQPQPAVFVIGRLLRQLTSPNMSLTCLMKDVGVLFNPKMVQCTCITHPVIPHSITQREGSEKAIQLWVLEHEV